MLRAIVFFGVLVVVPALASAQPCTTDARQVVNEIYRHMLERAPDPGSDRWIEGLNSGRMTVRDVVRDVAKSPEHLQRFGNESPDQVVATLYRHILGRQPDPEGQRAFVDVAARQGPAPVVDRIIDSLEYRQSFGEWGVPGSGGLNFCNSGARSGLNRNPGQNRNANRNEARRDRADDRFAYLDVNENGVVTRNEWDGSADEFDRIDRNGDRRLTRDEFLNAAAAPGQSRFNTLDDNGDGRITLNEWPGSRRAFNQQDLNGDGEISRREFRDNEVDTVR